MHSFPCSTRLTTHLPMVSLILCELSPSFHRCSLVSSSVCSHFVHTLCPPWFICAFSRPFSPSLVYPCVYSFCDRLNHSFAYEGTPSGGTSSIHRSFVHSWICSFIHFCYSFIKHVLCAHKPHLMDVWSDVTQPCPTLPCCPDLP